MSMDYHSTTLTPLVRLSVYVRVTLTVHMLSMDSTNLPYPPFQNIHLCQSNSDSTRNTMNYHSTTLLPLVRLTLLVRVLSKDYHSTTLSPLSKYPADIHSVNAGSSSAKSVGYKDSRPVDLIYMYIGALYTWPCSQALSPCVCSHAYNNSSI